MAVVVGAGCATAVAPFACGNLGEPAFVGSGGGPAYTGDFSPPADATEDEASPALVPLAGVVRDRETEAGLRFALVAIEIGGLDRANPASGQSDGARVPTLKIDPFYQYGATTDEAGAFSLDVPSEPVGVHVYKSGFFCGVPEAGAILPGSGAVFVEPEPLPNSDAGPARPAISGFTATPSMLAPGEVITLSAIVEAADPETDPLSEQVLAVEPLSGWAGVFAPPEPGTPGGSYPNGIYSRLVPAPLAPGKYTFYLVAATLSCVTSDLATQTVLVTP